MFKSKVFPIYSLIGFLALFLSCSNQTLIPTESDQASLKQVTEVYLVRHAEKELSQKDPKLTKAGQQRAIELYQSLKGKGIQHIHSSDFLRTRSTANPMADSLNLSVEIYNHKTLHELKNKMLKAGGKHLVVGHSNSTPDLVKLLGGDPVSPINEASEYDRLYHIQIEDDTIIRSSMSRYGQLFIPIEEAEKQ